jgi:hypothetical protein
MFTFLWKKMGRNKCFKVASWVGPTYRINAIFLCMFNMQKLRNLLLTDHVNVILTHAMKAMGGDPLIGWKGAVSFEGRRLYPREGTSSKSNPITGLDRPIGFQEVKAPRFQDNRHMKVVRLSAVLTGRLYSPGNIPGTQGHSAAGRIVSMKSSNDTIGNQTRAVPQPTAPPRGISSIHWICGCLCAIAGLWHSGKVRSSSSLPRFERNLTLTSNSSRKNRSFYFCRRQRMSVPKAAHNMYSTCIFFCNKKKLWLSSPLNGENLRVGA